MTRPPDPCPTVTSKGAGWIDLSSGTILRITCWEFGSRYGNCPIAGFRSECSGRCARSSIDPVDRQLDRVSVHGEAQHARGISLQADPGAGKQTQDTIHIADDLRSLSKPEPPFEADSALGRAI